jgi:hypothetical protein
MHINSKIGIDIKHIDIELCSPSSNRAVNGNGASMILVVNERGIE